MTYLLFVIGLAGLFFGGEFLIRGAVALAQRLHLSPMVIGLTVVGFGTSAPELLVSMQAALAGSPALAIGNVVGSNIANILLILGLSALVLPVPLPFLHLKRDLAVVVVATLALWLVMFGGIISRGEGIALFAALVLYLWASFRLNKMSPDADTEVPPSMRLAPSLLFALGGLVLLMIGARLLVDSATTIARDFGVSEAVIGLTIVAVGTSLPELAASIAAAMRGHPEIAVGNILGSNVFNILGILGLTAIVTPIPVDPRFSGLDLGIALGAILAMAAFSLALGRTGRLAGASFLAAYGGYAWMITGA